MAARKRVSDPAIQGQLDRLAMILGDGEAPDWSAVSQFELGALVALLGGVDGAVMIRSSERGASRSIGVFVGGQSQWTTCRDQRELLAMLEATVATLEAISGDVRATRPTAKGKRAQKGS